MIDKYTGIDIDKAMKHLNADKYLGNQEINGNVVSLFYSKKPNRAKKHLHYPFLFLRDNRLFVGAVDRLKRELKFINGVQCLVCHEQIYSIYRHDFVDCGCHNEASIDGGRHYCVIGAKDLNKVIRLRKNIETGRVYKKKSL